MDRAQNAKRTDPDHGRSQSFGWPWLGGSPERCWPGTAGRTEASELIDLIKDARGVDFYRSRPSLDAVLAGTEKKSPLQIKSRTFKRAQKRSSGRK
jgi:hypothetical protein